MFATITLIVDNDQVLLREFITLAKDAVNEYDLADTMESWFNDYAEALEVKFSDSPKTKRANSIESMFASILTAAINNISDEDWVAIARHYLTKANES
jgi:hypothetical protein